MFNNIRISELLELQKLRKTGAGIDLTKLNKGVTKKKPKKVVEEDKAEYGLQPGAGPPPAAEESVCCPIPVRVQLTGFPLVMRVMQKPKRGGS